MLLQRWVDRFLYRRGYRKYTPPVPTAFFQHTFARVEGNLFRCAECGEELASYKGRPL